MPNAIFATTHSSMVLRAGEGAVHRLRQRYQEIIRAAVRETLLNPEDLEDELRHLLGGAA